MLAATTSLVSSPSARCVVLVHQFSPCPVCPPAIQELCHQAASQNKPFILSLSAPFIPQFFKEPLDASAPYWDYVIGNETEAAAYAESHNLGTTDLKEIAKALANLPKENAKRKRVAIVTQGTEPTIVAVQGEADVKEYPVHLIAKEEIVDTTGAGDAFAAGFSAGVVEGKSLDESIDQGQWLARLSIKELGPSYVNLFHLTPSSHPVTRIYSGERTVHISMCYSAHVHTIRPVPLETVP
jgi:sugar/nucleoside kinase (ribokinase family)